MYLDVFSDNPFATNCWLAATDGSDDAVVVDPGFAPARVWEMLAAVGKRPVAVLATPGHLDHIGSAAEICSDDLPLYIHAADRLALTDAEAWGSGFPAPAVPVEIVRGGFDDERPGHPGHGPATTVGAERATNPFLVGVPWS